MKSIKLLSLTITISALIASCSIFGGAPTTVPQPPKKVNNNSDQIMLPQIGKNGGQAISESAAAAANESQPTKFKIITEQKGPGGAVNRVNVDNPDGGMPDYYLSPNSNIPTTTNNNPDKLSTPNWQISW